MNYPNIQSHLITCPPEAEEITFTKAEGITFTDEIGKQFLNLNDISCALGYGHPRFTRTLSELVQTRMLGHMGAFSPEKETLIANFMDITDHQFDKIFFAASGGEVVDWAIKAARRCTGRDGIISFRNALHGRSFAGAWVSGTPARKVGFGSGLEHVSFWDYPEDGRSFEPEADACNDIAAVIIEPFQALGGMVSPSKEYWQWLRRYTTEHGIVLILDEIQTGFGKTGTFFAYEQAGIVPDILLAGKGMSNGFGLGAMLMNKTVGDSIRWNEMSGGSADNDLMCSIVNLVFEIYRDEQIPEHAARMGQRMREGMCELFQSCAIPVKFHGTGLFFSAELPEGMAAKLAGDAKRQGILFGRSGQKLMVRAPLVITEAEVDHVCAVLRGILAQDGMV